MGGLGDGWVVLLLLLFVGVCCSLLSCSQFFVAACRCLLMLLPAVACNVLLFVVGCLATAVCCLLFVSCCPLLVACCCLLLPVVRRT